NYRENKNISNLLIYQIERAQTFYTSAYKKIPKEDINGQIAGLLMGKIYETLLLEIKRDRPEQVLNHKVILPPLRKLLVIFKCFLKNKFYAFSN
ncbi:MAG TPA: squalene synthase HpnD, partial [Methylophilaceae bacterium]|nr:squalene synthase HpnD [Methylophilaceae bacterium]